MKFFILFLSLFANLSMVLSQTYYLNVNFKDGTTVRYEIADIDKIDFENVTRLADAQKLHNVIKSFTLLQNFPNPFNPSTTIRYELQKKGMVEVNIYDVNGRLVNQLVKQNQSVGMHTVVWNGKNLFGDKVASGLYIYAVKFENTLYTKKMILLK